MDSVNQLPADSLGVTKEYLARAERVTPGGVHSNVRLTTHPHPLFFDRGEGTHLWDVDGNRYVDFILGQGAAFLGHGHPAVVGAVAAAANQVVVEGGDSILFHGYFGYPVGVSFPPSWLEGLDYHLTLNNEAPLEEDMVFHLPISLRRRGEQGVGLSYTVAVTSGGAEVLTGTPASLILV